MWIIVLEIKCADKKGEFENVLIRLEEFHTLMFFFEAIGELMTRSDIEEALQTMYAENSVTHMLKDKANSRTFRGQFLISLVHNALIVADVLKYSLPVEVNADSDCSEIASEMKCITGTAMKVETKIMIILTSKMYFTFQKTCSETILKPRKLFKIHIFMNFHEIVNDR